MKIRFFKAGTVKSPEELRKMYLRLMMILHPDVGGGNSTAKIIIAEYEYLRSHLDFSEGKQEKTREQTIIDDDKLREVIDRIIHMEGINIEIVGSWVWVDGDTYPWKEELKQNGFRWSRKRKKWHYTPYASGKYYRGSKSFDRIRAEYGSEKVTAKVNPCLN